MNFLQQPTKAQQALIDQRNKLIDEQDELRAHFFRTEETVLTDDDKKFDALQRQIDAINEKLK